ncbi:hypothetical protein HYH03_004405 [Edaphochlamys debaryana]|uniref:Kinesin-like protein n=1 Tax=Edaphochlamys debaryana TaxID=47281 RepID=A0A836C257_9CHLO|nr:hypothetical protein HYH03_004405 [Edaphochlamys debaryana]|eukprot:KAG2497666.1 hypothetical protein HYH03_004405 [Edaphochlamys debaryana]
MPDEDPGEGPPSPCPSDVSDIFPRRLRYSEEVLPLHFHDLGPTTAAGASNRSRPLKVYARVKPLSQGLGPIGGPSTAAAPGDAAPGPAAAAGPLLLTTATEVVLRSRANPGADGRAGAGGGAAAEGPSSSYSFHRVFEGSDNREFYEAAMEPLVEDLVSFSTATSVLMAYGASGTGKSYTMSGTATCPGMVPRALTRIYQLLEERGLQHQVQLCCYEILDNRVFDLLASARQGRRQAQALPIQVLGASCCVPGLLRCHCTSADNGQRLYAAAARIRRQAATQTNSESSRSHAVFTVQLLEVERGAVTGRSATLSLVDLAGAERAGRTKHVGSKLRESAGINASLSVLGRCIEALRHNQAVRAAAAAAAAAAGGAAGAGGGGAAGGGGGAVGGLHVIPVRESSLTQLFRGVLSGQGNLVLSVHLSQHPDEYDTNRHTLRFGALASRLTMAVAAPTVTATGLPRGVVAAAAARGPLQVEEPIPEGREEEGEEAAADGAKAEQAEAEEAGAADGGEREEGDEEEEVEGVRADGGNAELERLREEAQRLREQLAAAEEATREAVVAECEELMAAGREELEEARRRAAEVEAALEGFRAELRGCRRELEGCKAQLEAEQAAKRDLQRQLQELREARNGSATPASAAPASAAADPTRPQAGQPPGGIDTAAPGPLPGTCTVGEEKAGAGNGVGGSGAREEGSERRMPLAPRAPENGSGGAGGTGRTQGRPGRRRGGEVAAEGAAEGTGKMAGKTGGKRRRGGHGSGEEEEASEGREGRSKGLDSGTQATPVAARPRRKRRAGGSGSAHGE